MYIGVFAWLVKWEKQILATAIGLPLPPKKTGDNHFQLRQLSFMVFRISVVSLYLKDVWLPQFCFWIPKLLV